MDAYSHTDSPDSGVLLYDKQLARKRLATPWGGELRGLQEVLDLDYPSLYSKQATSRVPTNNVTKKTMEEHSTPHESDADHIPCVRSDCALIQSFDSPFFVLFFCLFL